MEISLKSLQQFQENFDRSHRGRVPFFEELSSESIEALEHSVVCLVGEVGEFANIVKKVRRGDFEYDAVSPDLAEELSDVFAYTLKLANMMGIDLSDAYLAKMEKNKQKFGKYEI